MYFIIVIVLLLVICICLDVKERKARNSNALDKDYVDIAHFTYEEKLRNYVSEYDSFSPILKTRF